MTGFAQKVGALSNTGLPPAVRRQRIQELAAGHDFVRVADLSKIFRISEVTVRNDLDVLEAEGVLRRVHGGAVAAVSSPKPETAFEESLGSHVNAKRAIGQAAAARVVDGETIILDVGTTTTAMARALAERDDLSGVTVFTNSLSAAHELEPAIPRLTVVVTGGTLRAIQHSLVDPLGSNIIERIRVDTAFLGCNGVDADEGITNVNLPEAEMKRRMIAAAKRSVVLADRSKLARVSTIRLCPLVGIDLLITAGDGDTADLASLEESGIVVEVADRQLWPQLETET